MANFEDLKGKTILEIKREEFGRKRDEHLIFITDDGSQYRMYHKRDCCETVSIEDINGDLDDLIGTPVLMAEEVSNYNPMDEKAKQSLEKVWKFGSYTWTFYQIATIKGYVTIRWFGESNGYYSEGVDFEKIA